MPNTGLKQATVAYFVSKPDGLPLDLSGVLTSISGNKQAIALLEGTANPNPALYDVAFYFTAAGIVTGNPTAQYSTDCAEGFITIAPTSVSLKVATPTATLTLASSHAWQVMPGGPTTYATLDISAGAAGIYEIKITRTATEGQGVYTFQNTVTGQTATLLVINIEVMLWIYATDSWNDNGFWLDDGILP